MIKLNKIGIGPFWSKMDPLLEGWNLILKHYDQRWLILDQNPVKLKSGYRNSNCKKGQKVTRSIYLIHGFWENKLFLGSTF